VSRTNTHPYNEVEEKVIKSISFNGFPLKDNIGLAKKAFKPVYDTENLEVRTICLMLLKRKDRSVTGPQTNGKLDELHDAYRRCQAVKRGLE